MLSPTPSPLALAWKLRFALQARRVFAASSLRLSQSISTSAARSAEGKKVVEDDGKKTSTSTKKNQDAKTKPPPPTAKEEIGGPRGPEPTRYNDWEKNGRVSDF